MYSAFPTAEGNLRTYPLGCRSSVGSLSNQCAESYLSAPDLIRQLASVSGIPGPHTRVPTSGPTAMVVEGDQVGLCISLSQETRLIMHAALRLDKVKGTGHQVAQYSSPSFSVIEGATGGGGACGELQC